MMEERAGEAVVSRIGFAERWLDRAKGQVITGNLTRGILTLVLADAEVHHALEVAGARPRRAPAWRVSGPLAGLIAFVVAGAMVIVVAHRPASLQASLDPVPAQIKLSTPVGAWLNLVPPPQSAPVRASMPAISHAPAVPPVGSYAVQRVLPVAAQATSTPRHPAGTRTTASSAAPMAPTTPAMQSVVPVPPAVTPPAVMTSPGLSAGDLIDLVLAAERALRSDAASR